MSNYVSDLLYGYKINNKLSSPALSEDIQFVKYQIGNTIIDIMKFVLH